MIESTLLSSMADIYIDRWYQPDCTIGRLTCGEFQCFTLELPWLDNQTGISCIPAGTYEYYFRISKRNGRVLELRNVKDRTYIQIHAGNFISDIEGCILVGDGVEWLNADKIPDVTNSVDTLQKLFNASDKQGFIHIN